MLQALATPQSKHHTGYLAETIHSRSQKVRLKD